MKDVSNGQSMIELLCAVAIITVLTAAAFPAWEPLIREQEGRRVMRGLATLLNNAKSAAIRENTDITICPAAPGTMRCATPWHHGAIAFIDPAGRRDPARESLVHRLQWPENGGELQWRAFGNRQYLVIDSRGYIRHQSGNFTWCPQNGDPQRARQLVVNATGRIRLAKDGDGDGIREDSRGRPLSCR